MDIFLAADHAGFKLKEALKDFLTKAGYHVKDFGASSLDPQDDYPDFISDAIKGLKKSLQEGTEALAIVLGGSGEGEAIVANKFKGIRAAVYYGGNKDIIALSKEHNDANVLSLGARFLSEKEAKEAVALWLEKKFSGEERHRRRIEKIKKLREALG